MEKKDAGTQVERGRKRGGNETRIGLLTISILHRSNRALDFPPSSNAFLIRPVTAVTRAARFAVPGPRKRGRGFVLVPQAPMTPISRVNRDIFHRPPALLSVALPSRAHPPPLSRFDNLVNAFTAILGVKKNRIKSSPPVIPRRRVNPSRQSFNASTSTIRKLERSRARPQSRRSIRRGG